MNSIEFDKEIKSLAATVLEEYTPIMDDYSDSVHEAVDGHQWVIYYHHALALVSEPGIDTDAGEDWLSDCYGTPFEGCETFSDAYTRLAYATMLVALQEKVQELLEAREDED